MWLPNSVAEEKEPVLMQHEDGFQCGRIWNEKRIDFKNIFLSTKNHESGTMVVDSLRHYRASLLIEDKYGKMIEFHDPIQQFVTKSPAPSKRKTTTDEEFKEPTAKKSKGNSHIAQSSYTQSGEYFDWQYDLRPEPQQPRQRVAVESKENVQPNDWIQAASSNLPEDERELLSVFLF
uniref:T-box domain-containing protein n=1 Tax=Caenorhabditis tropicalis TaxID=1561998 RepID=A0A1I7T608_9PELO